MDTEEEQPQQQQEEQLVGSSSATASEDEKLVRLEQEASAERSTLSKVASGDGSGGVQLSSVSIGSRSRESNRLPAARRCTESRQRRRCQSRIKELIGKHELKNERLGQREGQLSQRLQMLECTVPAVAVWRARQSSPETLRKLVEVATTTKTTAAGCRITPSRHYDCRVREIEAQRKEAHRRAEEARSLWLEREAVLQSQRARVELARQQQAERRLRMDQLTAEARKLEKEAGSAGEDAKKWLDLVESAASLCSSDLECLGRLESLAEAESCTRRRIAELEAKEQALMQALAQADQLVPADDELQRVKVQADEAEKQLKACQAVLARYREREVELLPSDKETQAMVELADVGAGREDDLATVRDRATQQPITGEASLESKETWAGVETANKDVDATVECVPACVGHYRSEANKSVVARAEMRDKLAQAGVILVDKNEATLPNFACGFTCGYPEDEEDEFTACCPPDFICNDVVDSVTGMMDASPNAEMNRKSRDTAGVSAATQGLSGSELAGRAKDSRVQLGPKVSDKEIQHKSVRDAESQQSLRDGTMKIPRSEIETCLSIVKDMHKKISATSKFPLVSDDFQKLKNIFASKLGLDSFTLEQGEKKTEEVTISSTSLKSSQRIESKSKASASTIDTKRSDNRSVDEVASAKSTLDKSESKKDAKSIKSILKSTPPSTIDDKKSGTTQPSKSQNKSPVQASESKKTEKPAGKSKAPSVELDNKSQKTIRSDKKSIMESTSKKSVMENNGFKSAQSAMKSKTPSVGGSRKSAGQTTQKSVGKTQESGSRQSSKSDVKSKAPSYRADDAKSNRRESEAKSSSSIREKSKTNDSLSSYNPERKEVARYDRGSASSKTRSEEAKKKSLNQVNSTENVGAESGELGESDVRQDSKVPETEVRSIELEESQQPSGSSRAIKSSESPRAEEEEGDVPEAMETVEGPLAAVEAEMAAAAFSFTIEFSTEVSLESQQQHPKLIEPEEEKVEPPLQELGEEAPKDKPDLSRQSAAVEATTDKGPDDKTDDDLCICEPLARIMRQQSKWPERQQPPVHSKLACGCPFERRARQDHRSVEKQQRAARRRTICQPPRHPRYPCHYCYRCGAPLRRAATERRIDECEEKRDDGPLTSEVPSSLSKREQGVLAKLPKAPSSSKRKKPKKRRGTLELLFDGASRKAARILEAISSGELIGLSAKPKLGSSCTCLKNQCRCGSESD
ncbi:uncharacterized protein LOC103316015 isoform X2 [Nasonia vitripennis]|uniref:Uncharacterized protein n=1 Tax=Nasonia vitripennis TaxID=7425 RepID=A0A7M7QPI4_NASVI|nr:uncharacterized protein LOC103316015 isoform X2 [Nasonia vitripennis]